MGVKNYSLADITQRIMISLPSRFSREEQTNVYKFFESIADAFKINADKIDEVITQTNLQSASGDYLDQYIGGLAGFGRLNLRYQGSLGTQDEFEIVTESGDNLYLPEVYTNEEETDQEYRDRYTDVIYTYDSTKAGILQIIIDFAYTEPERMYSGSIRGAYTSGTSAHAKHFFSDQANSLYGNGASAAYVGYIELTQKPPVEVLDLLCDHIERAKGYGIKIFIKYPQP